MKTYQFTIHLIGEGEDSNEALGDAWKEFEIDLFDPSLYQPKIILRNADAKPIIKPDWEPFKKYI